MRDLIKAVVQRRLRGEVVDQIVAVALTDAAYHAVLARRVPHALGEDVAVVILARETGLCALEPLVRIAGVTGHKVEQDLHITLMRLVEQVHEVVHRAVARRDFFVVAHIVAGVHERRVIDGVDPDRVAAESFDVIELDGDASQIADAVRVAVAEALGINLVKNSVFQPVSTHIIPPVFVIDL